MKRYFHHQGTKGTKNFRNEMKNDLRNLLIFAFLGELGVLVVPSFEVLSQ